MAALAPLGPRGRVPLPDVRVRQQRVPGGLPVDTLSWDSAGRRLAAGTSRGTVHMWEHRRMDSPWASAWTSSTR